ncbi:phage tail protein, partial [Serratia sp. Nf2]
MTVPFTRIHSNQRAPFFYAEFDNSMANTATAVQRTLLIGQMLSTATATPGIPQKVSSESAVAGICGNGSMLHNMMAAYLANDISA